MTIVVRGTYSEGVVRLSDPVDWPEGATVEVIASPRSNADEEWPTDPESLAALVARMDAIPAMVSTPEEEAEIAADRAMRAALDQQRREGRP